MAKEWKELWPPPQMALIVADIPWTLLLGESSIHQADIQVTHEDNNPLKRLYTQYTLLSAIVPQVTEWHAPLEGIPFLFKPHKKLGSRFTGAGTNSLKHAKQYCWYGIIALFWNAATRHAFGSELMVKNLSAVLRCYFVLDNRVLSSLTPIDPDATSQYYLAMTRALLILAKYNISTRPPADIAGVDLLALIRVLHMVLLSIHDITCPTTQRSFYTKLYARVIQEHYTCCGVYIAQMEQLPFQSQKKHVTTKETAVLLRESLECLRLGTKHAQKYIQLVERKLQSGYAMECTTDPTTYKTFNTPTFWTQHTTDTTLADIVLSDTNVQTQQKKIQDFIQRS